MLIAGNPDAQGNIRNGQKSAHLTDPIEVYKAHRRWNRGTAASYHFSAGYKEAAKDAGRSYDEIKASLRLVDEPFGALLPREQLMLLEMQMEQQKRLFGKPTEYHQTLYDKITAELE